MNGASSAIRRVFRARVVQIALMLALSLVVASLLGELAVYVFYGDRIALFPRYVTDVRYDRFHIRGNVPHAVYRHKSADGRWEFRINGRGFRDTREFPYEKPEGLLRVLALGDSFTIGYEVGQDQTYAAVLESYLRGRGVEAEVINAGMSGSSNAEELVFLEQEGWKYAPDFVVVGFYRNDLEDNVRADLYRLEDGRLELHRTDYLPAVGIRNTLNSFGLYRWLSEHSYLHNFLNNTATVWVKRRMARGAPAPEGQSGRAHREDLARRLVARMREVAAAAGAELILLDIPGRDLSPSFPVPHRPHGGGPASAGVDVADVYLDLALHLERERGTLELYRPHGHGHWTEHAHRIAGTRLGEIVMQRLEQAGGGRPR